MTMVLRICVATSLNLLINMLGLSQELYVILETSCCKWTMIFLWVLSLIRPSMLSTSLSVNLVTLEVYFILWSCSKLMYCSTRLLTEKDDPSSSLSLWWKKSITVHKATSLHHAMRFFISSCSEFDSLYVSALQSFWNSVKHDLW